MPQEPSHHAGVEAVHSPARPGRRSNPAPRPDAIDGRRARAQRTRDAVLDGLQDCFAAGIARPTAKQIASRAGVSLRGVFRHFETLDALLLALDKREHARLSAAIPDCPVEGSLDERIASFLRGCARIYEGTAPVRRALDTAPETSGRLARHRDRQRVLARQKISVVFARELGALPVDVRLERLHAITAFTSWRMWEELRNFEGLPVERTQRQIARRIENLLSPQEPEPSHPEPSVAVR